MTPALQGLLTIVIGVSGCVGYFYLSNQFLDKVLYPPRGPNAGRNINRANMIRPWLFLFPALAALGLYLAYPVVETLRLSLTERVPGGEEQHEHQSDEREAMPQDALEQATVGTVGSGIVGVVRGLGVRVRLSPGEEVRFGGFESLAPVTEKLEVPGIPAARGNAEEGG